MALSQRVRSRLAAVHPATWALIVVAMSTWTVAVTLFIGMVRNVQTDPNLIALDGTAFTLLSALIAMWTGFGVWAGRSNSRVQYLWVSTVALAGIVMFSGIGMLYLAITDQRPFSIPSNVAQLLILVTSALISIVGSSVGYSPTRSDGRLEAPPDDS